MAEAFEYLKKTFPKKYREIVLEHQAVNKVITFWKIFCLGFSWAYHLYSL